MTILVFDRTATIKVAVLICAFFLQATASCAQPASIWLSPVKKRYDYQVELNDKTGVVFGINYWMDKAGSGYTIGLTDTIARKSGTNGDYKGKNVSLENAQGKIFLIVNGGRKPIRIEMDTSGNTNAARIRINNGYWWKSFIQLSDRVNNEFPLYHYSFRIGFDMWDSFKNKDAPYSDFFLFADEKIKRLSDSVRAIQIPYVLLTERLIDRASTIEYAALKDSLLLLPTVPIGNYDESSVNYFRRVIQAVGLTRPELFFKLAEDMPDKKDMIFSAATFGPDNKELIETLKSAKTNSPAKSEFFKERSRDKRTAVAAMTIYGTMLVLFWWLVISALI